MNLHFSVKLCTKKKYTSKLDMESMTTKFHMNKVLKLSARFMIPVFKKFLKGKFPIKSSWLYKKKNGTQA